MESHDSGVRTTRLPGAGSRLKREINRARMS